MSEEKCTPRPTADCEEKELKAATEKGSCEDFSICLPFGGKLYSVDGCVKVEQGNPPEDGTYGKVLVQDGCIIGLAAGEASQYTVNPCAPVPSPCDCDGGTSITISPRNDNLSSLDSQGRLLTVLYTEAGSGIEISGNGTQQNPLTISTASDSGSASGSVSGIWGDAYVIPDSHTGNVTLSHKKSALGATTANGFTIDACGHIIGYSASDPGGVLGVLGSTTIDAVTDNNSGIVTVSLKELMDAPDGTLLHGGYNVTVDDYGRVTAIERAISINSGTYTLGDYDVTLNTLGSVTGIKKNSGSGGDSGSSTGLVSNGVVGSATWTGSLNPIEVPFTLAKASPVRVFVTVNVNAPSHEIIADIDGTIDFNRSATHMGCTMIYTRTKVSAGSHVMHLAPSNISGNAEQVSYVFEIQAFTLATITGGDS